MPYKKLSVLMTTYNRVDLLKYTIDSYNNATAIPDEIVVVDDCSTDESVEVLVNSIKNVNYIKNKTNKGCHINTPEALMYLFNRGDDAVIVLDSDIQLAKNWWNRANEIYEIMLRDNIACASLFHAGQEISSPDENGMSKSIAFGALGMIVTSEFFNKYIKPITIDVERKITFWDNKCVSNAIANKETVMVSNPSYIQHLGTYEGTHVGAINHIYSGRFIEECTYNKAFSVRKEVENKKILLASMGGHRDCIIGAIFASMLEKIGYHITWCTIPYYSELLSFLCPSMGRKLFDCNVSVEFFHTSAKEMHDKFGGYKYYINAQSNSPEHYSNMVNSGKPFYVFIREHIESVIGKKIGGTIINNLPTIKAIDVNFKVSQYRPIVIISDKIQENLRKDLYDRYSSNGYDVYYVSKSAPQNVSSRERRKYIYNYKFIQLMSIIMMADVYIGTDSGLSWASLFNRKCNKTIYHSNGKRLEVETVYRDIDPLAKDMEIY